MWLTLLITVVPRAIWAAGATLALSAEPQPAPAMRPG
jgi:hypothetical protein